MVSSLFDVTKQLTFYGSYHANKTNILIHMLCLPLLVWSFQVMGCEIPVPSFIPPVHHEFNEYLVFNLNIATIISGLYLLYYIALEPVAALLYVPQLALSLLTATAFSYRSDAMSKGAMLNGVAWIAQFLGHGLAEKRAPALLDNIAGAFILAPFFVHLEILFSLGYKPELHKRVQNGVGMEIARIKKEEAQKKRAAGKKL
jgi:uncharacterized membrane protein YGL010W